MANKYRKVEFKLHKELIIMVAVLLVLLVVTIILQQPTKSEAFINKWSEAGSSISTNTLFEEVGYSELKSIIDKKEGKQVVLVATPSNEDSVKLFDEVLGTASSYDVTKVYLLDGYDYLESESKDDSLKVTLKCPTLWLFENGTIVQEYSQTIVENNGMNEAVKRVLSYNLSK